MSIRLSGRGLQLLLAALAIYVVWSQIALRRTGAALAAERQRVYALADFIELWKSMAIRDRGQLDPVALAQERVQLTELPAPSAWPGQRLYTLTYPPPDLERQRQLERYFSEQVLHRQLYVLTDARGRIDELSWDAP